MFSDGKEETVPVCLKMDPLQFCFKWMGDSGRVVNKELLSSVFGYLKKENDCDSGLVN